MRRDDLVGLLGRLCETPGVPGFEAPVAAVLEDALSGAAAITFDNVGNVYFEKKGDGDAPRVILPAHLDEIGFLVTRVDEGGFVRFLPLGGWFDQVLLGQRVKVITKKGGCTGVIGSKPPHLLDDEARNKVVKKREMFIDVGASSEEDARERLGIRPGDPIVPDAPFLRMADSSRYLGRAFDDRVGAAVMAAVLLDLASERHPNTVIGVGTVQEELGTRGAKTAPSVARPDACIVLETGISADVPGIKPEETQGELGKGPMICILDGGMLPHLGMRDFLVETAEEEGIPFQFTSLSRGATDGREIQPFGRGVPSVYVGVPTRYIHAHSGVIDIEDVENTIRLVKAALLRLDVARMEEIRSRIRFAR